MTNTIAPDIEFVTEWIEALESGEYRQGQGYLNRYGEMCCLGVACELLAIKGKLNKNDFANSDAVFYGEFDRVLPDDARPWLNLTAEGDLTWLRTRSCTCGSESCGSPSTPTDLASLNDSGVTFAKIADVLRYHYQLPRKAAR